MSEQYLLPNPTTKLIKAFCHAAGRKGVQLTITSLAHSTVAWNPTSRAALTSLQTGQNTPSNGRTNLPPHFYIEIPSGTGAALFYEIDGDFARALTRSSSSMFKTLDGNSKQSWDIGRKIDSLVTECKKGPVSISVYHLDGKEMTQALRDGAAKLVLKVG